MVLQRSKEWFDLRKNHIGSSDAATIFLGSELDRLKLWEKKKGLRDEDPINEFMQRGIDLEDDARNFLNNLLDCYMLPDVRTCDFMLSSIDGIEGNKAVEIKCPTFRKSLEMAQRGEIDIRHQIQMQHHMKVWELDRIHYFIYFSDDDNHLFLLHRDDKFIAEIMEKEKIFYDQMKGDIPPLVERSDSAWVRAEHDYILALEQEKRAKEQMEHAKARMIELSEGTSAMGRSLMLTKSIRKGSVDYSQIPELKSLDLEKYRKEDTFFYTIRKKQVANSDISAPMPF